MKKVLLLLFLMIYASKSEAQWTTIAQSAGIVESMEFISSTRGYACSSYGYSITNDGGASWAFTQTSGFRDFDFIDSLNGCSAGAGGVMKKTTNGSASWSTITPINVTSLWGASMISVDTFFISTTNGLVYRTYNGGSSFTIHTVTPGSSPTLSDIYFTSSQNGCVTTSGGAIYKTTNSGTTWSSAVYTTPVTAGLNALYFVNPNVGFAVGSSGIIAKTINGGSTWTTQTSGTLRRLHSVHFCDVNNGVAVGDTGVVLRTTNGGTTWFMENIPSTLNLRAVHMLQPNSVVIGGDNVFYKNSNLTTSVGEIESINLCSVSPNPATGLIEVSVDPFINKGHIMLVDLFGKILLVDEFVGSSKVVDVSVLPPGMYLIQISDRDRFIQKKIIKN